jgi:hypothetical protein
VNAACAFAVTCVLALAAHAEQTGAGGHMAEGAADTTGPAADKTEELAEISRQLENPLTSLWSLTFENSLLLKQGDAIDDTELANTLWFQPGLPIPVGKNKQWVWISRPVFPLVTSPVLDPTASDGVGGHVTGFGDMQLLSLFGPNRKGGIVWGAGGTFIFPTASDEWLGEDKYQAGPAAMLFRIRKPLTLGFLAQHWWSYAGDDDRPDTSRTDIKYIARYQLPRAWSIGFGPTISIDWKADDDEKLTFPVGLGLTKMARFGKTPLKFIVEVNYSAIRPDDYGTEWKFIFRIAPVIQSPFH